VQTVVDRIKKLRALGASSNEHEAARARERAADLMQRHGVTEDELAEAVVEVVDVERDEYREAVAGIAAGLQGCRVVCKRQEIGFRGRPDRVRRATGFYSSALDLYRSSVVGMNRIVATWLRDPSEIVWRFYFWNGFAEAVYERRPEAREARQERARAAAREEAEEAAAETDPEADVPRRPRSRPRARPEPPRADPVDVMRERARELARNIDVDWLAKEAHRTGRSMGLQVALRLSEADFALPGRAR